MAKTLGDLEIGALVKDPGSTFLGKPIIWKIADKYHEGYPSGAITLITERSIAMRCFDAGEPKHGSSSFQQYGNSKYLYSNIRQWLNSDAGAGAWYVAQYVADAPPNSSNVRNAVNPYDTKAGFLNAFSAKFKMALMPTTLKVLEDKVTGGSELKTVTDKIFLASKAEVGLEGLVEYAEGVKLALFGSRVAYCTTEAIADSNYSSNPENNQGWAWWLRTPYSLTSAYIITYSGNEGEEHASTGKYGVRPLCNLNSTVPVSDATDTDGCYLIENISPIISGDNGNLGVKSAAFSYAYTVTDVENDPFSVLEAVDGRALKAYDLKSGEEHRAGVSVSGSEWTRLAQGDHTLTVTATDDRNGIAIRTMSFTKSVDFCSFTLADEEIMEMPEMPERMTIEVIREVAAGATLTVEVCNNAFDAIPTWENATSAVLSGLAHVFTNKVKTASKWGVNIRVRIDRNGAIGNCRIYGVGGYKK